MRLKFLQNVHIFRKKSVDQSGAISGSFGYLAICEAILIMFLREAPLRSWGSQKLDVPLVCVCVCVTDFREFLY